MLHSWQQNLGGIHPIETRHLGLRYESHPKNKRLQIRISEQLEERKTLPSVILYPQLNSDEFLELPHHAILLNSLRFYSPVSFFVTTASGKL